MLYNLGSINIDHVYEVADLPKPGETIHSKNYMVNLGGKGLNISVAAHRFGAPVRHIGLVGRNDVTVQNLLARTELDQSLISEIDTPTGHAVIHVDGQSENSITIHGGANQMFTPDYVAASLAQANRNDWLILQNETNANDMAIQEARKRGMRIGLVAAPFSDALIDQIPLVDLVTMNESESAQFEAKTGQKISAYQDTDFLITLGSKGAIYYADGKSDSIDAIPVAPVDTTGAGDTFFGVFMASISGGDTAPEALEYATKAAALMVQRKGAAAVIPTRSEILNMTARE